MTGRTNATRPARLRWGGGVYSERRGLYRIPAPGTEIRTWSGSGPRARCDIIDASVGVPEREENGIELGPFFTAGVLLLAYGLRRRNALALGAGFGAIWLDQRTEFGRGLRKRVRSAMKNQIKAGAARNDLTATSEPR